MLYVTDLQNQLTETCALIIDDLVINDNNSSNKKLTKAKKSISNIENINLELLCQVQLIHS